MIYVDSSVALARLLTEPRNAPDTLWQDELISSRLLEYEVWNRIHASELGLRLGERTQNLLRYIDLLDLSPPVLERALEPFPLRVRTLDALHLATLEYVRSSGQDVKLASFDNRLTAAARALGIETYEIQAGSHP